MAHWPNWAILETGAIVNAALRLGAVALLTAACGDASPPLEGASTAIELRAPSGMPAFERRILALDEADLAEVHYFPMGVSTTGQITFFASRNERPMFRIVDSLGKRVGSFGRQGEGPGEFRLPLRLHVRGDTVQIHDSGRMRLIEYSVEGRFIRESRSPGLDITLAQLGDSIDHWRPPAMNPGLSPVIRRSSIDGSGTRVVIPEADSGFQSVVASNPAGRPLMRLPYGLGPDRIFLGDAYQYRIFVYNPAGQLITTFGRDLPPHYMGPQELAVRRAILERSDRGMPGPNGERIPLPDNARRLDTLDREITPHFDRDALNVDAYGRLWVIGRTNDSTTVDVFADTTFLGRAVLPCFLSRYGHPVALTTGWLLLECALPEEADQSYELQLYRVTEAGVAQRDQ